MAISIFDKKNNHRNYKKVTAPHVLPRYAIANNCSGEGMEVWFYIGRLAPSYSIPH